MDSLKPLPDQIGALKREVVDINEDVSMADAEVAVPAAVITTRAGRTSKTATPLASTFPEQLGARNRVARNKDLGGSSHASSESGERGRKKRGANSVPTSTKADAEIPAEEQSDAGEEIDAEDMDVDDADADVGEEEGNEPKYCYCNDVSYGEMVACDNEACPREWFHLRCAGLSKAPDENSKSYFCGKGRFLT